MEEDEKRGIIEGFEIGIGRASVEREGFMNIYILKGPTRSGFRFA